MVLGEDKPIIAKTFRVIGIDPGTRKMGWALVEGSAQPRLLAGGTLRPDGKADLAVRLGLIFLELQLIFDTHRADALAIEAAFVHVNPHTALALGQARGLPIALAASRGMPVHEYPPALVKRRVVGSGRAEKGQMRAMMQILLKLPVLPAEDEADAMAVALTHLRELQLGASLTAPKGLPAALAPVAHTAQPTAAQSIWLAQLARSKKS